MTLEVEKKYGKLAFLTATLNVQDVYTTGRWFLKFHLSLAQYSNWFLFKAEEGGMKAKLWQRTYQLSIVVEPKLKTKLSSTVHTNICFLTTRFKAMNISFSSSSKWFVSHKLTDLSDQLWDSQNCLLPLSLLHRQKFPLAAIHPLWPFFFPLLKKSVVKLFMVWQKEKKIKDDSF